MIRGVAFTACIVVVLGVACGGPEPDPSSDGTTEEAVTGATLTLAPAPSFFANFGSVPVGGTRDEIFVVTNVGTRQTSSRITLSVSGAAFSIVPPGAFECASGTTTLPPGQSCRFRARFTATAIGTTSTGTLRAHASSGGTATLALTGTAIGVPSLGTNPINFLFFSMPVGSQSPARFFQIFNLGTGPTGPLSLSFGGPNASDFALASDNCGGRPLAPRAVCLVSITMT